MRVRNLGRCALVATCAAGAVAISGCGASNTVSHAAASVSNLVDPVAQAAVVSASSSGYKLSMQMQATSPALGGAIDATGTGSFSPANRVGTLTMNLNLGSSSAVSALLGSTLTIQAIIHHETYYMKLPAALTSKLPGAKPWVEFNIAKLASSTGIPGISSLLNNPTTSNPGEMLQYLKAASGTVTKVGTATVNGVPTTEYKATIDLAKYPSLVPAAQRTAASQAIAALEKDTNGAKFPTEVFIDAHHLVRRMVMNISENIPSAGQIKEALTINMLSYGPQPTPAIPSSGEITNANSLLGSLLGSAG